MLHRSQPGIRVNKQKAELLCLFALNIPSACSKTRESFPSALKAKQTTIRGLSKRPLRVAVSRWSSDVTDMLKSRGGTVPLTLHVTAGLGLESTEQRHSTSISSTAQTEDSCRMAGLSGRKKSTYSLTVVLVWFMSYNHFDFKSSIWE